MRRAYPPDPKLSAARREGWKTRRAKYGQSGHAGSYSRSPADLSRWVRAEKRLARLVAYCLGDGVLTEGQIARIIEADRLDVRAMRDDGRACLEARPLGGAWGTGAMKRMEET
jgi:hypothetical protein